jgi:hypothetical protein
LPDLVKRAGKRKRPSLSLLDNAVRIGPYRKPGAILIPEVDAEAHVERERELERRAEDAENAVDELLLANLVSDRVAARDRGSDGGTRIERVAEELGFEDLLEGT